MKRIKSKDILWNELQNKADIYLKEHSVPYRVSRQYQEIHQNAPVLYIILPVSWNKKLTDELLLVPGINIGKTFTGKSIRYRRYSLTIPYEEFIIKEHEIIA